MKLSQFKFKLPEEQIAQYPAAYERDAEGNIVKRVEGLEAHRDECRLMVLHKKSKRIEHKIFKEIVEYFDDKDLFVFNDTQVPAQSKLFKSEMCGHVIPQSLMAFFHFVSSSSNDTPTTPNPCLLYFLYASMT